MVLVGLAVFLFVAVAALAFCAVRYVDHFKKLDLLYAADSINEVVVEKNLEYKKSGDRSLRMDVYKPADAQSKVPAIIFVHGEGVERMMRDIKDWNLYVSYGKLAGSKGFAGVTFHRGRTNLGFNHADVAQDILDAVEFVRKNAEQWNIDSDRICVWGFSLGGLYLSLFTNKTPGYVKCMVSYYGLLDIKFKTKKLNEQNSGYRPENYLPENPEGFPPFLLVKAAKDKVRGVIQSQDHFMEVAKSRGIPFECIVHSTGQHSFDALDDNEETREVMERTWDFIERNLQGC